MEALLWVLVVAAVAGGVLRGLGWLRRWRVIGGIPPASVRRSARGVSLKVLADAASSLPGMNPARANRTVGDLVVTDDRLVLVCSRGVLVDARAGAGCVTARAPGPDRLVIEGQTPTSSGEAGAFRVELVLPDARGWADALRPFARA